MNSSKYYYFDVTDILEYSRFNSTLSGIQRVSLRIIGYLVEKYGSERIRLIAYHPTRRVVISADSSFLNARYTFEKNAFCDYFALDKHYYEFDEYLKRKYKNKNKRKFHRARLRFSNFVTRGKSLKKRRVLYDWFAHTEHGLRKVELVPGDTVVILGATWGFDEHLSFLKKERETKKIRIVQLVHDLIPLVTPEHVGDNHPDNFYRWLKFMSGCCDLFLASSNHTKNDLQGFLNGIGCAGSEVKVLPLAHEFVSAGPASLANYRTDTLLRDPDQYPHNLRVRAHVLNVARLPYVLCVGTLETRKNIWTLANVWRELHGLLGNKLPRLVFAGKRGWLISDFDEFIRGTGSLCGYINVCEGPYDFELEYLYKRCIFTVFPSYYEGWGLPVGESLWCGKTAAISNSSSMPEVGGDMVEYFDPYSPDSMRETIMKLIVDPELRRQKTEKINTGRLRSWKQVSEELYNILETDARVQLAGRSCGDANGYN